MLKKIIITILLLSSLVTNSQESDDPSIRAIQLDENSDFKYYPLALYWVKSPLNPFRERVFFRFYKDDDNDGFGDKNGAYIALKSYEGFNVNDEERSASVYNSSTNELLYTINYRLARYFYNGSYWVFPYRTVKKYFNTTDYKGYGYIYDLNDNSFDTNQSLGLYYRDIDGDGYGNPLISRIFRLGFPDIGYVNNSNDCNDYDALVTTQNINWYQDLDGDGYGNSNISILSCQKPSGYVGNFDDCDDTNPNYNNQLITWYADFDGDGFGDPNDMIVSACRPANYVDGKYFDACPTVAGTRTNGCPLVTHNFDNNTKNYQYNRTYLQPYTPSQLTGVASNEVIETIAYTDGLGRAKQTISIGAAGDSDTKDIVTYFEYDSNGEVSKSYLPYALNNNNGQFDQNSKANTLSYYQNSVSDPTQNPYTEVSRENSPLNRTIEIGAPGNDWLLNKSVDTDHTIKQEYATNVASDHVRKFHVNFLSNDIKQPSFKDDGFYAVGELYKTVVKDENWTPGQGKDRTTEEFVDVFNRIVLKRTYNNNKAHDTYYVYDSFGNLTYVLSPEVNTYTGIQVWADQNFMFELDDSSTQSEIEEVFNAEEIDEAYVGITFNVNNNSMYVNFEASFNSQIPALYDTVEIPLTFNPPLPDVHLGEIEGNDYYNGWSSVGEMYIEDNKLIIESDILRRQSGASSYELFATINLSTLQNNQQYALPITQQDIDKLGYQYKYDNKNRVIEKKIPGKGWESIIYDSLDRPILTQDALQKSKGQWLFTKYDAQGRITYTGIYNNPSSRATIQSAVDGFLTNNPNRLYEERTTSNTINGVSLSYTNRAYPNSNQIEIHTINYYDTYTNLPLGVIAPTSVYGEPITTNTRGLTTVSKVRVLESNNWITTVLYYDDKGQSVYTYVENTYLNTEDVVETKLDFTGKVQETKSTHKKGTDPSIVVIDKYSYDHVGRLLTQKQAINGGGEELIVKNHYNALGQLIKKDVGNTEGSPLQEVDYSYNVRGWLKKINDPDVGLGNDLFSMELCYNDDGSRLYNGNISAIHWKTASDNVKRRYNYYYDDLNRMISSSYNAWSEGSRFNTYGVTYDKNGNLKRLIRRGAIVDNPVVTNSSNYSVMDYLNYTYDGNQLTSVTDTGHKNYGFKDGTNINADYTYDANGNMISDQNKGIANIEYNHLNLPTKVAFNVNQFIEYTYDATGTKVLKKITDNGNTTNTHYAGSYIYQDNALQFFSQPEGYVQADNGQFSYVYQYKDHLGNIRLSYTKNNDSNQEVIYTDGFESLNNWDRSVNAYGWAISALDNTKKHSGTYSGRIDDNYPTNWEKYVYGNTWVPINNAEDTYYTISAWVFVEDIPNNDAQIFLATRKAGETGTPSGHYSTTTTQRGVWEYVEKVVKVPADVRELNIRIDNNKDGTVWFDDVRIVKGNLSQTLIVDESNYYPFGLKHKGYNNVISANGNYIARKFGYNGVEMEKSLNLNLYEMDWRGYDPALGRFMQIDPLADVEEQLDKSTYAFAWNSPILLNDPSGLCPDCPAGAEEGDIHDVNDETYIYEGGDWWRVEQLDEIKIETPSQSSNYDPIGMEAMYDEYGELLDYDEIDWSRVYRKEIDQLVREIHSGMSQAALVIMEAGLAVAPIPGLGVAVGAGVRVLKPVVSKLVTRNVVKAVGNVAAKSSANLLKAASAPSKGGLTAVGRALQKHGSRAGSIYPKATGNAASINAQGQSVLKGILNNPNATTATRHHARFGNIMDIRVPGGQGARFSADGKTFLHFLE